MVNITQHNAMGRLGTRSIPAVVYLLALAWWVRATITPVLIPNFDVILKLMTAPLSSDLDGERLHGSALSWIIGWAISIDGPRELRWLFGVESVVAIAGIIWAVGHPWRRDSIGALVAVSTCSWMYVQFHWLSYDALTLLLLALVAGFYLRGGRLVYLAMLLLGLQHFEILLTNILTVGPLLWVRHRSRATESVGRAWRPRDLAAMVSLGLFARLGLSVTYGLLGVREHSRISWVVRRGFLDGRSAWDDGVWLGWSVLGLGWLIFVAHMTIARPAERFAVALGPIVAMGVALFNTDHTRTGAMSLVWLSLLVVRSVACHPWANHRSVIGVLSALTLLQPWIWVWEGRTVLSWWLV
jgi:hypothetical protein